MAAGRPSKYSKDVLKETEAYLAACVDSFDEFVRTKKANGKASEWRNRLVVRLPSIAGPAVYLKVARGTIYVWAKANSEFQDILERILAEQERRVDRCQPA